MTASNNETTQRTALITGSGRNIGRAIALELAANGSNVILNGSSDRSACEQVASEVEALGGTALVAMGDVGDREISQEILDAGLKAFGRIDILVNNAAIRPGFDLINDAEEEFHRIMNVNFYAALWLSRGCLPGMVENSWGRIINFTGMLAQQGFSGKSAVSVSKHASWGLIKSIAKEYGRSGVTANIISPGTIVGEVEEASFVAKYPALKKDNPTGRLGEPIDIATMVSYLVADNSGFVNGQLLQVNGGVVV